MEGKISYTEASEMTIDEIMLVNAAIDSLIDRKKNAKGG